jgi:hypothetical protein
VQYLSSYSVKGKAMCRLEQQRREREGDV